MLPDTLKQNVPDGVCIVGAKGMLGRELVRLCEGADGFRPIAYHALDREEIDIREPVSTGKVINELRPSIVINAAAYTDVDGCESNRDEAEAANALGPMNLARACQRYDTLLIQVGTDYVFDGQKTEPYRPTDRVHPKSVYGRTKADGEQNVREICDRHVIVRSSWLFGAGGKNFVKTILRLAREREELKIVDDQVGSPTYARDLAAILLALGGTSLNGTYHYCNADRCSWYAFAGEIVRQAGLSTRILPQSTAELNRPAPRPAFSVLDSQDLVRELGIEIRPWQQALADCLRELNAAADYGQPVPE